MRCYAVFSGKTRTLFIMVGEIRDGETAELAVRAALTGHVVFATLHTTSAAEAVYRLQNMGIPAYMVAAVLRAVIAQRLVRKRCGDCAGAGCTACAGTGYQGRTIVAELIAVDTELADHIGAGLPVEQLRIMLKKRKHRTLYDDAAEKAAMGITTESEIRRELGTRL
jgi:type II secretory ATPase GspE/PulE/Tfp pilus assembly ATPase PilB-like protein